MATAEHKPNLVPCAVCGHPKAEHGKERDLFPDTDSKRELCMECPGYTMIVGAYEVNGYPNGQAWHRFRQLEG